MRNQHTQQVQGPQRSRWQRFIDFTFAESGWQRRHPAKAAVLYTTFSIVACLVLLAVFSNGLPFAGQKTTPPPVSTPTVQRVTPPLSSSTNQAMPQVAATPQKPIHAQLLTFGDSPYGTKIYCQLLRYALVPYGHKCTVVIQPETVRQINKKLGAYGPQATAVVATTATGACAAAGVAWWSGLCGLAAGFAAEYAIKQIAIAAWEHRCIAIHFEVNLSRILLPWLVYTASIAVYGAGGGYVTEWRPIKPGSKDGDYWRVWNYSRDHCSYATTPPNWA